MKLSQIEHVIALAEHGSLRAAARKLGVSAPALSKSLKALEREYSAPLLHRSVRGVELTAFGQALLKRARAIHAEVERAHEELAQMQGSRRGTVSVGVSPAAAVLLAPSAIKSLLQDYPEVKVRIVDSLFPLAFGSLRDGQLDCLIGPLPYGPGTDAGRLPREFEVEALFISEVGVAARPGHPLASARSVRDLAHADWLVVGPPGGPGAAISDAFEKAGVGPPHFVVTCDSFTAAQAILRETDLLASMPLRLLGPGGLLEGSLVQVPVAEALREARVCLITRADVPLTPAAQAFIAHVRRAARLLVGRLKVGRR